MKTYVAIFVLLLTITMPSVFAHPDFMGAKISSSDGAPVKYNIMYVEKEEKKAEETLELFSKEWFWHNFIYFLIGAITLIMGITIMINFKEDLPWKKI